MKYKGGEKAAYPDVQVIVENLHNMNQVLGSVYIDAAIIKLIEASYMIKDLRGLVERQKEQ
jgi:hypothetical protein